MKAVFTEAEKKKAFKTKKRLFIGWLIVLILTLGALATLITLNMVDVSRTGSRALKTPFMVTSIAILILFCGGSIFFFDIKYRLTSRYCKMLTSIDTGLKERGEGKFIELNKTISEKDGVFFHSLMLDCPPIKRGDVTERKILVEKDHALPKFEVGEKIKFITHANILIAYERVEMASVKENNEQKEN